jgi:hypothetical protein
MQSKAMANPNHNIFWLFGYESGFGDQGIRVHALVTVGCMPAPLDELTTTKRLFVYFMLLSGTCHFLVG